jgi:hypothetical protein
VTILWSMQFVYTMTHTPYLYTNLFRQSVSITCLCKRGCKNEWMDERKNKCMDVCWLLSRDGASVTCLLSRNECPANSLSSQTNCICQTVVTIVRQNSALSRRTSLTGRNKIKLNLLDYP